MSDAFVANNQPLLIWLTHFNLTALPAHIDQNILKNAIYIHYLGLTVFAGIFSFILSLPLLWPMSKGWSDFFAENPEQFYFLRKIGCVFLAAAACTWLIYAGSNDWKHGIEFDKDSGLRFTAAPYTLARWAMVGCALPILLSAFIGSIISALQHFKKPRITP